MDVNDEVDLHEARFRNIGDTRKVRLPYCDDRFLILISFKAFHGAFYYNPKRTGNSWCLELKSKRDKVCNVTLNFFTDPDGEDILLTIELEKFEP